jgi:hypothetical protein
LECDRCAYFAIEDAARRWESSGRKEKSTANRFDSPWISMMRAGAKR